MTRILIVDDSPTIARLLKAIFESEPDMEVVGHASNGREALQMVQSRQPDLITMDIHMPVMDGFEATRQIMEQHPTPIVVVSSLLEDKQMKVSYRVLEYGAVAVLAKPPAPTDPAFKEISQRLVDTVRAMAGMKVIRHRRSASGSVASRPLSKLQLQNCKLVAMGASTGGPKVLAELLSELPADFAIPIVVVQHIAEGFLPGMIDWLNSLTELNCCIARNNDVLQPGNVYFAPDGSHAEINGSAGQYVVELKNEQPVNRHMPSVTPLFESLSVVAPAESLGLMLSGMGKDGADGMLSLNRAGGYCIAQQPTSCTVGSMPESAIALDAVNEVLTPAQIIVRLKEIHQNVITDHESINS